MCPCPVSNLRANNHDIQSPLLESYTLRAITKIINASDCIKTRKKKFCQQKIKKPKKNFGFIYNLILDRKHGYEENLL